ncbi:unnamed protein product [Rotaria magnacalcarata]|uniref:Uncharacterized protein n=1 Tax=Rotaria magnacalcarata TaxID=392030 RepID=A0A816PTW3_9BILA|nr:unnamed protein product [Rotaria magnacalcarata]
MRMQIEEGCLDLLQIIVEIARPNSASSHDGKKQVVTVPGSLRKLQAIEPPSKHEGYVYAASIINETGLIRTAGRTYVSIRSAKHDHLMQLKEFEKFSRDHFGSVKPIVVINVDTDSLENNTRYSKTLSAAIDKFKKYNLDALVIANQAPGQGLFNIVERCLPSTPHDLAGFILLLPHDHFGTHLKACVEEDEEAPLDQCVNQTRSISTVPKTEVKNECDID